MSTKREPAVTTEDVAPLLGDPTIVTQGPARPAGTRFGMCEGTREELARTGRAIDPFTGEVYERS